MDDRQAEWFRRNLRLGDDWIIDDVEYKIHPFILKVHVKFIGELVCPICGEKTPRL